MNITHLRTLLARDGVDADAFDHLATLAERIDPSFIEPRVAGLDETASAVLVSQLLRRLAPTMDVDFDHPDVLGELQFDVTEPGRPDDAASATSAESPSYVSDSAA